MKAARAYRNGLYGCVAVGSALLASTDASADLLAYEGFEYERVQWFTPWDHVDGIGGLDGGEGWSGGWQDGGGSQLFDGDNYAIRGGIAGADDFGVDAGARAAPLNYVDSEGNELVTSGNQYRGAFGNHNREYRSLDVDAPLGETGTTLWMSFLAQAHATGTNYTRLGLTQGFTGPGAYFGKVHGQGNWAIQSPNVTSDIPASEQVMYLVRIDFNDWEAGQSDVVSVWLNPDRLDEAPSSPATLVLDELLGDLWVDTLELHSRYSTDYDEIRLGTTFESVTPYIPVPEPASLALLASGLAMLARRTRHGDRWAQCSEALRMRSVSLSDCGDRLTRITP